jgi:hypothetical protein
MLRKRDVQYVYVDNLYNRISPPNRVLRDPTLRATEVTWSAYRYLFAHLSAICWDPPLKHVTAQQGVPIMVFTAPLNCCLR